MTMTVKGSCNCGDIEFVVTTKITDVYVCHCSICRKSTGAGAIAVTVVNNDKFSWVKGQGLIQTWGKPNHGWQTSFCTNCGSSLPGKNDDNATYIPVGLLDSGYEALTVKHHLFVASKAPWEEIADNGIQHPNNFCSTNT